MTPNQEPSEVEALPAEAFTARLATRTTEPVNKRLRLWALLRDYNLQVALTLALARGLPSDEELASELAGGKRTDAGTTA